MIAIGTRAPDFTLLDHASQPTTLASLLGGRTLILFFYPADFTPVCTREACMFRDAYGELETAGLTVAGVSPDRPDSHARFRAQHGIGYALLSDPDKVAIGAYGVRGPLGIGVRRASFLIDAQGTILDAVLADLRVGRHEAFVRAALANR